MKGSTIYTTQKGKLKRRWDISLISLYSPGDHIKGG
jgi:hypothetical protein